MSKCDFVVFGCIPLEFEKKSGMIGEKNGVLEEKVVYLKKQNADSRGIISLEPCPAATPVQLPAGVPLLTPFGAVD